MYKINKENLKKEKSFNRVFFLVGLFFFVICTWVIVAQGFYDIDLGGDQIVKDNPIMFLIFIGLITVPFMYIGFRGMKEVDKKRKKYEYLAKYGELKRGYPYVLRGTGSSVGGSEIMKIVVDYELPSGSVLQLESDGRYDFKLSDSDGLVDILIDPNDPNNYYIDFNIEEEYGGY